MSRDQIEEILARICALHCRGKYPRGMNSLGNVGSLVASHPGNTNAVKHGAYSPRLMQERAAELEADLVAGYTLSPTELVAAKEAACLMAILEAINRDLEESGLVNKKGEAKSLLNYRARISRQLERWLDRISSTIDRQSAPPRTGAVSEEDLRGEFERIALGHDRTATAHDRLLALTALAKSSPAVPPFNGATIRIISGPDGKPAVKYIDEDFDVDDSFW